jgi:hypothetical protein
MEQDMKELGRMGGLKSGLKPVSFRISRAKKAANARWAKKREEDALKYRAELETASN